MLFLHNGLIYRPSFITMSRTELYYEACCWEFLWKSYNDGTEGFLLLLPQITPLFPLHALIPPAFIVPRMASTMPSFSTSIDPEQTKKMAWSASPCRRRYSPGAQKEVLMCSDRERRQPRLAEANSESSRISLLRCMVMSDRSSSGKSFSSWEYDGIEKCREWDREKEETGKSERRRDSYENTTMLQLQWLRFQPWLYLIWLLSYCITGNTSVKSSLIYIAPNQ